MQVNHLSIDLLTHDLDFRSFLLSVRRENERYRELSAFQNDRQHPLNNSRGFTRMNKYNYLSPIPCHLITEDGIQITDELSKQLLDDNLSIVRRHWQRSRIEFATKMKDIQVDFNTHTNRSMKKTMCTCQTAIFNWISKNRLK